MHPHNCFHCKLALKYQPFNGTAIAIAIAIAFALAAIDTATIGSTEIVVYLVA